MRRLIAGGVVWMLIGAVVPARGQTPSTRAPNRVEELQLGSRLVRRVGDDQRRHAGEVHDVPVAAVDADQLRLG